MDEDGIVAGHKRRLAALAIYEKGGTIRLPGGRELPAGQVPVLDVSGWSEAQRRAYIIADNQTTLESEWDTDVLKLELSWLEGSGEIDMGLTGFDGDALAKALGIGAGRRLPPFVSGMRSKPMPSRLRALPRSWQARCDPGLSGQRITSWTGCSRPSRGLPMRVVAIAANARRIWPPGCVRLGRCAISVQRSVISDQIKEKRSQKNGKPRRAWPTACAQHRRGWTTKKLPPVLLPYGRAGKWKDRARRGMPSG